MFTRTQITSLSSFPSLIGLSSQRCKQHNPTLLFHFRPPNDEQITQTCSRNVLPNHTFFFWCVCVCYPPHPPCQPNTNTQSKNTKRSVWLVNCTIITLKHSNATWFRGKVSLQAVSLGLITQSKVCSLQRRLTSSCVLWSRARLDAAARSDRCLASSCVRAAEPPGPPPLWLCQDQDKSLWSRKEVGAGSWICSIWKLQKEVGGIYCCCCCCLYTSIIPVLYIITCILHD